MNIDYSRQQKIENLVIPETITVVGTGAVGSWVAYLATLSGVKRLLLYALGDVKATDIARLPFPPEMVGKPYSFAVASLLLAVRPSVDLVISGEFRPNIDSIEGTVFNCASSPQKDFARELYAQCLQKKLRYVSGGYKGNTVFVQKEVPKDFVPPSLDPIPVWAGTAATSAVAFLSMGFSATQPDDYAVDLVAGTLKPPSAATYSNSGV